MGLPDSLENLVILTYARQANREEDLDRIAPSGRQAQSGERGRDADAEQLGRRQRRDGGQQDAPANGAQPEVDTAEQEDRHDPPVGEMAEGGADLVEVEA